MNMTMSKIVFSESNTDMREACTMLMAFATICPIELAKQDSRVFALWKVGGALHNTGDTYLTREMLEEGCAAEDALKSEGTMSPHGGVAWDKDKDWDLKYALNQMYNFKCCKSILQLYDKHLKLQRGEL